MFAGIGACLKGRPCNGRYWGYRRGQRFEAALLLHLGQIRKLSFSNELLGKYRVHAVHTDYDETFYFTSGVGFATAKKTKQPTNRPGQQRKEAGENAGNDDKDRTAYGETGPGAYVGKRRCRRHENNAGGNNAYAEPLPYP